MVRTTWVDDLLARIYRKKSFEENLVLALELEAALARASRAAVKRNEYDLHMSLCRMEAINDWMHDTNIRKELK